MSDAELDRLHVAVMDQLHQMRSHLINAEQLLRLIHQDRHPVPKPKIDMSPTQPLDPETRLEIDSIA